MAAVGYRPSRFWVAISWALVAMVLPPVYLVVAAVGVMRHGSQAWWGALLLCVLIFAATAVVRGRVVRHLGLPMWQSVLTPISSGLYCMIGASSAWRHHFGEGNVWKGRTYSRDELGREQVAGAVATKS